jgi:hypothetical protein
VVDQDDLRAWNEHMRSKPKYDPEGAPPALHVRYYYPQPQDLTKAYEAWVERWHNVVDISSGKQLFSQATDELVDRTKKDIEQWYYSGGQG